MNKLEALQKLDFLCGLGADKQGLIHFAMIDIPVFHSAGSFLQVELRWKEIVACFVFWKVL